MRNVIRNSFRISLQWPIHIINPVDKTKLASNNHTPQLLFMISFLPYYISHSFGAFFTSSSFIPISVCFRAVSSSDFACFA